MDSNITDHVGNVPGHLGADGAAHGDLLGVAVQGRDVSLLPAPDCSRPEGASEGATRYQVLASLSQAKIYSYLIVAVGLFVVNLT